MAADMKISTAAANAALDAVVALLDAGAGAGIIEIYGGTVPASVAAAPGSDLLATITLDDPAFGAASGGVATASVSTTAETNATAGTATFFRASDSDGTDIIQGTCGTSAADMILNTTTIASGATVSLTAWTITMPLEAA